MSDLNKSQTGAVTVDWAVLTAAIVGLGLTTAVVVSPSSQEINLDLESQLNLSSITLTSFEYGLEEFWREDISRGAYWSAQGQPYVTRVVFETGLASIETLEVSEILEWIAEEHPHWGASSDNEWPRVQFEMMVEHAKTLGIADPAAAAMAKHYPNEVL